MSKGVFVPVPTDLTVEDTTSEKSITEETLWPPEPAPTSSDKPSTLETRKRPGPDRNTESEEPTEDLVTEESTIQGEMTTKTDSGRTVTVPNDKVVTVTRHTTIVTERPPSSSSTLPAEQTVDAGQPSNSQLEGTSSEPFPSVSENLEPASTGDSGPALPQGGIIGIGIGGAALIAFLVGLFLMIKRSRKRRAKQELGNEADSNDQDSGRGDRYDEKHFPQKMSVQSTGTQGSRDPFAPFGGRVNTESEYPNRPASNTFEMDATVSSPVELPDKEPVEAGGTPVINTKPPPVLHVEDSGPTDPRANLNSLGNEGGTPNYVNHWDQYRAMASR